MEKAVSVFLSVALGAVLTLSTAKVSGAPKDHSDWRANMNKISTALAETVPYLYPDPSLNEKNLTAKVKRLYELTKAIDVKAAHVMQMPDDDPVLPYIASMFRQDVERAYVSLQDGHSEYAKQVLRSSVSYCITCHTRNQAGAQFPVMSAFEKPLARASWIERLEFQTASRQYDLVLSEVMGKLKNSGTPGISALDLERGSRIALSLLVRIKKDADRAALLAQAVLDSPAATISMHEAAKAWMKDIRQWQAEKNRKFDDPQALLAEARQLVGGDAPASDHAEIRYLRASSLLHQYLQQAPAPKAATAAEALYLTGRAYSQLGEIGMWSLHEFYYVACIDKAPHSPIAESCFKAYDESMTLGYSGSAGTNIPKAVREHLARLKEKAQVKAATGTRI